MSNNNEKNLTAMRLDKWLWCARFYKTRSLALAAIKGGRIKSDGARLKPARLITAGDKLEIYIKPYTYEIVVRALARSRGSATVADSLYEESEESISTRHALAVQFKSAAGSISPAVRPDKRERRKIIRFTRRPG